MSALHSSDMSPQVAIRSPVLRFIFRFPLSEFRFVLPSCLELTGGSDYKTGVQSMKILVSAIACNPYHGSEGYFGWSAVLALARDHELWVLTHRRSQTELEQATAEGLVPANVRFAYAGDFQPWHPNRMRARLQSWREYQRFSRAILPVARELHAREKFDLAHHVTYATWRVASPLWKLGIPFVFGPVGGYEQFPARCFSILSPSAMAFELARMGSNLASRLSPAVRACLRHADHVFVANAETEQLACQVRGSSTGVSQLLPGFYSRTSIDAFSRFVSDKVLTGPLRIFAAGNMEGRKGVALALKALAQAKAAGVNFHYRLGAGGPEVGHLKSLAAQLGLTEQVTFGEGLRGEAYHRELGATHLCLLPSFRESAGLTMMEAMLAGCVPVVADCGGHGAIVTPECGIKISVTNPRQMVAQLAAAIIAIDKDRSRIREKGQAASQRIARDFSEENYRAQINAVYRQVTGLDRCQAERQ
jgi:glycosyltransferase involved in cell wall biosynthesis